MSGETKSYGFDTDLEDLDTADWTPHAQTNDTEPKPDLKQVREIAEKEGFTSREPKAADTKEPQDQITIRGPKRVMDDFRAFGAAQAPKWPHGYLLERALDALKKELAGQGG